MSFGGYGGPSSDPFGGQPFGGQPSGGWAGPQSGPPNYQVPPPRSEETNPLSTLSIVFAFVFAPAGAVLGHIALSQIKRLHQKGRDRAIIGLVLSYFMILMLVIGLVVWAALPSDKPMPAIANPPTTSSSSSAPTTGATTTTTSPPTTAKPNVVAMPITGANFTDVLLNGGALTALLNQKFEAAAKDRQVGSLDTMPNGLANESAASPHECVGATRVAQRSVFQGTGVQHFGSENWWTAASGPVMKVEEAVVVYASPTEAQAAFTAFTNQWQACEGRTMTVLAGQASDGSNYITTANNVRVTDSVLSAALASDRSSGGWARASAHALGVKGNCLVDVEVGFYGVAPGQDPVSGMNNSGIDVAKAMMARIA
ncbi:sensor domain-containing protein [Mycobacterium sp. DL99]|uniref:sensor domain-containing protein n=1 Tax=Mycobacterium sp. DL99 TaxID=2528957 RepID=UPI0014368DEC|nr:sensor domain-containing protein [Mycobacterium sp. DL99]